MMVAGDPMRPESWQEFHFRESGRAKIPNDSHQIGSSASLRPSPRLFFSSCFFRLSTRSLASFCVVVSTDIDPCLRSCASVCRFF